MKEMMIMMATMMPQERLIEEVKDAASEALLVPTQDNLDKLVMHCHMMTIRHATQGDMSKATDMMQDMDKFEKRQKLFETDSN